MITCNSGVVPPLDRCFCCTMLVDVGLQLNVTFLFAVFREDVNYHPCVSYRFAILVISVQNLFRSCGTGFFSFCVVYFSSYVCGGCFCLVELLSVARKL